MKNKETLEEAKKYAELSYYGDEVDAFVRGVKWQAERMYSEEDVNHLEWIYNRMIGLHNENKDYDYMVKFKEILDQFKTK